MTNSTVTKLTKTSIEKYEQLEKMYDLLALVEPKEKTEINKKLLEELKTLTDELIAISINIETKEDEKLEPSVAMEVTNKLIEIRTTLRLLNIILK